MSNCVRCLSVDDRLRWRRWRTSQLCCSSHFNIHRHIIYTTTITAARINRCLHYATSLNNSRESCLKFGHKVLRCPRLLSVSSPRPFVAQAAFKALNELEWSVFSLGCGSWRGPGQAASAAVAVSCWSDKTRMNLTSTTLQVGDVVLLIASPTAYRYATAPPWDACGCEIGTNKPLSAWLN